jgi:flagellar hook-associated protein 2
MSAITPLRFSGISDFSQDFQQILNRTVQIAALPIQQLQSQQSNLIGKKQSLTALNTSLQSLTSALSDLGELGRTRSLSVSSSNANKVSVVNNGVSAASTYTITEISSVAKAASETTSTGLATAGATAVDTDDSLELVLGSTTYALDLSTYGNNLNGLRDAINASGAAVTATVLNTGSNYYLSISANSTGAQALQVRTAAGNAGSNLLSATNQGANAEFKLNGLDVEQSDNVISTVVPGLTFTILDETDVDESITLTASSSRGGTATALNGLVSAYNSARDKVRLQIGENAGLLSGDFAVGEVSRTLREIAGYRGPGSTVKSLADLGIELDKSGVMSFNSTKFYSLGTAAVEAAFTFLGSETTGFGALSRKLDQISNPITGFIRTQQNNYDASDTRIQKQVAAISARIERLQASMSQKLQQADALLATLKSQQNLLDASIKSVNFSLYGKNT